MDTVRNTAKIINKKELTSQQALTMALFAVLLSIMLVLAAAASHSDGSAASRISFLALAAAAVFVFVEEFDRPKKRIRKTEPHRLRSRRTVSSIFGELGPSYTRRAYWMKEQQFWKLHRLIKSNLVNPRTGKKKHKNGGKNGIIPTESRLSAALRYFAGGKPDDIALVHGISHSEVFNSVGRWLTQLITVMNWPSASHRNTRRKEH